MTEAEIDEIVIAQAEDDAQWEEPVQVKRTGVAALSLPADLAVQEIAGRMSA